MSPKDLELEALIAELAPTEGARATLLEEHRQLEKDLLRLADPLPPADFLQKVMAKVESTPAPSPSRRDAFLAAIIVFAALSSAGIAYFSRANSVSAFGLSFAQFVVRGRDTAVGLFSGLFALWSTATLPLLCGLLLTFAASLLALTRLLRPALEVRAS